MSETVNSIIESIDSIINSMRVIMNTLYEDDEYQEGEQQPQQQETERCVICQYDFDSNELHHLLCGHVFCPEELVKWGATQRDYNHPNSSCPICRVTVRVFPELNPELGVLPKWAHSFYSQCIYFRNQ
jgi:hypothetical protein